MVSLTGVSSLVAKEGGFTPAVLVGSTGLDGRFLPTMLLRSVVRESESVDIETSAVGNALGRHDKCYFVEKDTDGSANGHSVESPWDNEGAKQERADVSDSDASVPKVFAIGSFLDFADRLSGNL